MRDRRSEPEAVERDEDAVEMASVWIAERGLHCSLKLGIYEDVPNVDERKAWGILLADIARHVSVGLSQMYGLNQIENMEKIIESFKAEIGNPTSPLAGGIK